MAGGVEWGEGEKRRKAGVSGVRLLRQKIAKSVQTGAVSGHALVSLFAAGQYYPSAFGISLYQQQFFSFLKSGGKHFATRGFHIVEQNQIVNQRSDVFLKAIGLPLEPKHLPGIRVNAQNLMKICQVFGEKIIQFVIRDGVLCFNAHDLDVFTQCLDKDEAVFLRMSMKKPVVGPILPLYAYGNTHSWYFLHSFFS
jgi:hypothetical protein